MKLEDKLILEILNNDFECKKDTNLVNYGFHIFLSKDNTLTIMDYKKDKHLDLPNEMLLDLIDTFANHLKIRVYRK